MGALPSRNDRRFWPALLFLLIILTLVAGRAHATTVDAPHADSAAADDATTLFLPHISVPPLPPQIEVVPFASGFGELTIMDIANAGDERLFIANREGKVWIVYPDGAVEPNLFLDVTKLVQLGADGNGNDFEQGFLGLAFHPDYPDTPYFYIAYTSPSHVQIARGAASAGNPNVADPKSIIGLISIHKPPATGGPSPVHNGGDLAFGPDGYLYIPVGDGGPDPYDPLGVPGDPNNNAQRRDTLLGSILRIDVDPARGLTQDCGVSDNYSIPPGNPWLNDAGCDEIWAKGLRNPWRMSIDPLTGDFFIGDVGEWLREEVNHYPGGASGGANFGWHCWEGSVDYTTIHPQLAADCGAGTQYVFPIHQYDHSQGECSIIGGKVYRGSQYPTLYGRYFFADWCSGRLWTMSRETGEWKVDSAGRQPVAFSTFGEDMHGELYAGGYMSGTLYRVVVR